LLNLPKSVNLSEYSRLLDLLHTHGLHRADLQPTRVEPTNRCLRNHLCSNRDAITVLLCDIANVRNLQLQSAYNLDPDGHHDIGRSCTCVFDLLVLLHVVNGLSWSVPSDSRDVHDTLLAELGPGHVHRPF
jgi:hypothetical protein